MANEPVLTQKLADLAVTAPKIANGAITAVKIQNSAVTAPKFAPGSVNNAKISSSAAIAGTKVSPDFGNQLVKTTGSLSCGSVNGSHMGGLRNKLRNGCFRFWQRGTTITNTGSPSTVYGPDAMWCWKSAVDGTFTFSRQQWTAGDTSVPFHHQYYRRMSQGATLGTTSTYVGSDAEWGGTFAGQVCTLSFWIRSSGGNITLPGEMLCKQWFGSGGSTESNTNISSYLVSGSWDLTSTWQRMVFTFTMPSISGKVFGTTNGSIEWLLKLPVAAFTIDIANVQWEQGNVATDFEWRPYAVEGDLCFRHYFKATVNADGYGWFWANSASASYLSHICNFPVRMARSPSVTLDLTNVSYNNCSALVVQDQNPDGFQTTVTTTAAGWYRAIQWTWTASAEL